jgi:hypothetical protein
VVFILTDWKFVRERSGAGPAGAADRFDFTVAVVALPGPRPVGQYTVRGKEYPLTRPRNNFLAFDRKDLARWAESFLDTPAGAAGPTR